MHGDVVTLTFRRRGQICTRTSPHQEKQKLRAPTLIFNKMAVRTMRRAFGSVSRQQTLHFGRNLVRMVIHLLWVATSFILLPLDNAILLAVYIIGLVSHLLSSSCPSRQRKAALRNEHFYPKTVLVTGIDTPPRTGGRTILVLRRAPGRGREHHEFLHPIWREHVPDARSFLQNLAVAIYSTTAGHHIQRESGHLVPVFGQGYHHGRCEGQGSD